MISNVKSTPESDHSGETSEEPVQNGQNLTKQGGEYSSRRVSHSPSSKSSKKRKKSRYSMASSSDSSKRKNKHEISDTGHSSSNNELNPPSPSTNKPPRESSRKSSLQASSQDISDHSSSHVGRKDNQKASSSSQTSSKKSLSHSPSRTSYEDSLSTRTSSSKADQSDRTPTQSVTFLEGMDKFLFVSAHAASVMPTVMCANGDVIFVAAAGQLMAVNVDGTVLWQVQYSSAHNRPASICHSINPDEPYIYIGHRGRIHVFNTQTQLQVFEWKSGTKSFVSMTPSGRFIIAAIPGWIWALDASSFDLFWKQPISGIGSTVALHVVKHHNEDIVLACTYHNSDRSVLLSFRLLDGSPRWTPHSLRSGYCSGSAAIISHDGFIIIGASGGTIQGLHPIEKTNRFRTPFGRSWISFATTQGHTNPNCSQPLVQEHYIAIQNNAI